MNYKFNITITRKCNLHCPHCYTKDRKGSLTQEQINTIVDNLEDCLTRVKIEGGEVYCERDLFYHTIQRFRERFGEGLDIRANTNAVAFYQTRDSILQEADMLYKLGVKRIRISLDKFHEDGGANLDRVRAVAEVLGEVKHPLEVRYMSLDEALAIGRAEDLPEHQKEKSRCKNSPNCLVNPYLFTDIKGDLYACCWRLIPPMGNLLESRLSDILANMPDVQKKLIVGDLSDLMTDDYIKKIRQEKGDCMVCKEVFKICP